MPLAILIDIGKAIDPIQCGNDCKAFVDRWDYWCADHHRNRLALIDVRKPNEYFHKVLDAKSRNMIRKCTKTGYTFRPFTYNNYLDAMYQINTSKEIRQGKPMSEKYRVRPEPIVKDYELCEMHKHIWWGGFKDQELLAYCNLVVLKDIAIINTILGHDKALTYGIMNGLINRLVWVSKTTGVKYLNYLDLENCSKSMRRFKESVGFESYRVEFS
jgi:hypothetical protein